MEKHHKYALLHKHLDEDAVNRILEISKTANWSEGLITGGLRKDVRWVDTYPINHDHYPWLVEIVHKIAFDINEEWDYNIDTVSQITLLKYGPGGRYTMHQDVKWDQKPKQRKLTLIIQLSDSSDYEGGDITFLHHNTPDLKMRDKGSVIIFPACYRHQIGRVLSGERMSVVSWILGPHEEYGEDWR